MDLEPEKSIDHIDHEVDHVSRPLLLSCSDDAGVVVQRHFQSLVNACSLLLPDYLPAAASLFLWGTMDSCSFVGLLLCVTMKLFMVEKLICSLIRKAW